MNQTEKIGCYLIQDVCLKPMMEPHETGENYMKKRNVS